MKTLYALKSTSQSGYLDRPGWIPSEITDNWDTNPYAYQTEEELMPASGLHGMILCYMMEVLRVFLESKGLSFMIDAFMLYRDNFGVKQRVSPDLLLMPYRALPPSVYDLDYEPLPSLIVELTSPSSRVKDLTDKLNFYNGLGIANYMVIDAVTTRDKLRKQFVIHLWEKNKGQIQKALADSEGYFALPKIGLKIKAVGQHLIFADIVTGNILKDTKALLDFSENERKRADEAEKIAADAIKLAEKEKQRAEEAQEQVQKLLEQLRSMEKKVHSNND